MRVLMASEPAPGQVHNEDIVFHHRNFVGVLDGVTQPSGADNGCIHGTYWYVTHLAQQIRKSIDLAPAAPAIEILASAIAATSSDHGGRCDLSNPSTPAATVALLRANSTSLDYLVLCDTFIVLDDGNGTRLVTDSRFEAAIAPIRGRYLTADPHAEPEELKRRFEAANREKQLLTNTEGGYWIAASTPEAAMRSLTGSQPLTGSQGTRRVALLTDGASRAVDTFDLMSWSELLDVAEKQGPNEIIRRVREAEHHVSLADRPRFKKHDDATLALCLIGEKP